MRLQDLRQDVEFATAPTGSTPYDPVNQSPTMIEVARRVAALYDICFPCKGTGQRGKHPDEVRCRFCEGTGMTGSPEARAWFEQYGIGDVWLFPALARFLFGDTP